jgi:hypothetical protein
MGAKANTATQTRDHSIGRNPAAVVFALVELAAFATFVSLARFDWFSGDEWDFLSDRSAMSLHDLFRPHNQHWSTLPVLVFRALYSVVGLHSYVPYLVVVITLHLVVAALLRQVIVRSGVDPWIATLAASAFAVFGTGYFNIVYAFQIGFDGALVCGLAQLLYADHDGPFDRRDWIGLGFGLAGLMCSGVAVSMTVAVGVVVFVRRGWRTAVFHCAPLATAYLVWLVTIGRTGYSGTSYSSFSETIRFASHDLWSTFVALGSYGVVGGALVVMLFVWCATTVTRPRGSEVSRRIGPIALATAAVLFLLITGTGRADPHTGLVQTGPAASRYLHVTAALVLPALAVAADAIVRFRRLLLVAVVPLFVIGIPANIHVMVEHTYDGRAQSRAYKQYMLALPSLAIAPQLPRSTHVDPFFDSWVTMGWLLDSARSGRIPRPGPVAPSFAAAVTSALALRPNRITLGARNCTQIASGGFVTLSPPDSVLVDGVVRVRYLPPHQGAPPAFPLGAPGEKRSFAVIARSMRVRVVDTSGGSRLAVCHGGN